MIIKLKKSPILFGLLSTAHAIAAVLVLTLPIGAGWMALLLLLIAGSFHHQRRRAPGREILLDDQGRLRFDPDGEPLQVTGATRDPLALRFTLEDGNGRRRPLLLMRDALDSKTYHTLCSRIAQRRLPPAEHTRK